MQGFSSPSSMIALRPGVWTQESWVRFFGMTVQTRMVVLQLRDGLLIYSPCTPDAETCKALEQLGNVRWIVAPNEIHNLGLCAFQAAYPKAHTTGCVGHPRRVPRARFDVLLDAGGSEDAVPWTASGELRLHVITGNQFLHEIAIFHVSTRTLVCADAVEIIGDSHLAGQGPGVAKSWLMRKMGLRLGEPCMSPEHLVFCTHPNALAVSLATIEAWGFDALVIAHGQVLEGIAARKAVHNAFTANIIRARSRGPTVRALLGWAARII